MNNENFFERKGFYIILLLCVSAIGVAGYVSFFSGDNEKIMADEQIVQVQSEQNDIIMTDIEPTPIEKKPEEVEETIKTEDPTLVAEEPVVKVEENQEVQVTKESEPKYKKPVSGEVINANSNNELVFDETMKVWRTHNATDYKVLAGENVLAISDGTVRSVTTDDLYGTIVTIEHSGGLVTKTYGLASDTNASVDKKVVAGDVLGKAQGIFLAEEKLGEHIHIEASIDGKMIDIETLFE